MTLCLVIGGGACVWDDLAAAQELCKPDYVVACNDMGAAYSGELDAFCTLHPDKLPEWMGKRRQLRRPEPKRVISHQKQTMIDGRGAEYITEVLDYKWEGGTGVSGSSGLYCVKVSFEILKADKVLLCGVPMDARPHFFDDKAWDQVVNFRMSWNALQSTLRGRVKSMSGYTKELLGAPDKKWLQT